MIRKEVDREVLAAAFLKKKEFLIWIKDLHGYYRPVYGVKPALGYPCGIIRGEEAYLEGMIGRIIGSSNAFKSRSDNVGHLVYDVQEFPAHDDRKPARLSNIPGSRIFCIFRQIPTMIVERYFDNNEKEKDDEDFSGLYADCWD